MKLAQLLAPALFLSTLSNQAFACSFTIPPPSQTVARSSVVALAYPISVSTVPANALSLSYRGEFQQTVKWQLLVSWKGKYLPGDVLTTVSTYEAGTSNCGTGALYDQTIKLIYLSGNRRPFKLPGIYEPQLRIEDLKYLQRIR